MISKDKTYRTRGGREVRIYATDGGDGTAIHGSFKEGDRWQIVNWKSDGQFYEFHESHLDLIEVKPRHKRTVWLHVFNTSTVCATEDAYYDITNRIACIRVDLDFEEGEGLTEAVYSTGTSYTIGSGGSHSFDNGGGFTPSTWTKVTKEGL